MSSKFLNIYRIGVVQRLVFTNILVGNHRAVYLHTSSFCVKTPRNPWMIVRHSSILPKSQYDIPFPKKMRFGTLFKNNWEVIPLFAVTGIAMSIMFFSIFWAMGHKVDVSFTHSVCDTLSKTMDLRHPPTLKLFVINQRYEPWPEMHEAVEKVKAAERKAIRAQKKDAC